MNELFRYTPPDDERATLTVTGGSAHCTVACTWSYEGVSVDLTPAAALELGRILIGLADVR